MSQTVVIDNKVYKVLQPDAVVTAGGMRLAPKPRDKAGCKSCGQIIHRYNCRDHTLPKHIGLYTCRRCNKGWSANGKCCATTCLKCFANKPDNGKHRCESCIQASNQLSAKTRSERKKLTILKDKLTEKFRRMNYEGLSPAMVELFKKGITR